MANEGILRTMHDPGPALAFELIDAWPVLDEGFDWTQCPFWRDKLLCQGRPNRDENNIASSENNIASSHET
jgi:hypothetical protein